MGGREVSLTLKEYDLLNLLIVNKNVAMSREQLYEAVWQEEYYGDTRTLDNHIKRLNEGKCSASVGAQYLKLSSDVERIGDHLININDKNYEISH